MSTASHLAVTTISDSSGGTVRSGPPPPPPHAPPPSSATSTRKRSVLISEERPSYSEEHGARCAGVLREDVRGHAGRRRDCAHRHPEPGSTIDGCLALDADGAALRAGASLQ